jgi:hypothetical protein
MSNQYQLTPSFPSLESFVAAYGCGEQPVFVETQEPKWFNLNGVVKQARRFVAFPAKHGAYRIPGVGTVHGAHLMVVDGGLS